MKERERLLHGRTEAVRCIAGNRTDRIEAGNQKGGGMFSIFHTSTGRKGSDGSDLPEQSREEKLALLRAQLETADAILIGAGSGLSTAAGYVYTGERMDRYFSDFAQQYGFRDMYSGGFYPYSSMEEFWGFWCRYIWINRYVPIPSDLYEQLFTLVEGKEYFVLTTNVDHCFQRSGFDKARLFYTQGDYGLFQSSRPKGASADKTYDNYETIRAMVLSEGFRIGENNELLVPDDGKVLMRVPKELVPRCPDDGHLMTTNLRSDDSFVEDAGWHQAAQRYMDFLHRHERDHILYLELGVGMNTPVIIKFPFQRQTADNPKAVYANINLQTDAPEEILDRSILINGDIAAAIHNLADKV